MPVSWWFGFAAVQTCREQSVSVHFHSQAETGSPWLIWHHWYAVLWLYMNSRSPAVETSVISLKYSSAPVLQNRALLSSSSQMLLDNTWWACAAASLAQCGGMICNLAVNEWDLEESPDSRANLLFLTSTVCEPLREMKEDGDCKVQEENFKSAKTRFLVAPGNSKTRAVIMIPPACPGQWNTLRSNHVHQQNMSGIIWVPLLNSNRNYGGCFLCWSPHGQRQNFSGTVALFQNLNVCKQCSPCEAALMVAAGSW